VGGFWGAVVLVELLVFVVREKPGATPGNRRERCARYGAECGDVIDASAPAGVEAFRDILDAETWADGFTGRGGIHQVFSRHSSFSSHSSGFACNRARQKPSEFLLGGWK
jgi:hypothetical protein